ncbi:hypothetical protein CMK13_05570 [Candidatus Poribacteria bacterium]|nr:hypothetical protein [Candidatus Poribacteria bacterium]
MKQTKKQFMKDKIINKVLDETLDTIIDNVDEVLRNLQNDLRRKNTLIGIDLFTLNKEEMFVKVVVELNNRINNNN